MRDRLTQRFPSISYLYCATHNCRSTDRAEQALRLLSNTTKCEYLRNFDNKLFSEFTVSKASDTKVLIHMLIDLVTVELEAGNLSALMRFKYQPTVRGLTIG